MSAQYAAKVQRPRNCVTVGDFLEDMTLFDRKPFDAIAPDDQPEDTGLLDQHGNKLYRLSPRIPMGFAR